MLTSGRSPRCWGLIRVTMLLAATQLPPTQANLSSKSRESAFIGYSESGRSVGHKCVDHEMECASYAQDGLCRSPAVKRSCMRSCNLCPATAAEKQERKQALGQVGCATAEATGHFARQYKRYPHGHFRQIHALTLSTLGLGTSMRSGTPAAVKAQSEAIVEAVLGGVNVLQTAGHVHDGAADEAMKRALAILQRHHNVPREALLIVSAIGSLGEKGAEVGAADELYQKLAAHVRPTDIVQHKHCIAVPCLEELFARSHKNLGVEAIDVLLLDGAELQLSFVGRAHFLERVLAAFRLFEQWRSKGHIKAYGLSAWTTFHLPASHPQSLSLEDVVDLAQQAGGFESNGFRYIQVPVNAKMPEVWENRVQAAGERSNMTLVEAAHHFDVAILGYSPLLSGALLTDPVGHQVAQHSALQSIQDVGAKLVQVARSVPGVVSVVTGQSVIKHVMANTAVLEYPLLTKSQLNSIYRAKTFEQRFGQPDDR